MRERTCSFGCEMLTGVFGEILQRVRVGCGVISLSFVVFVITSSRSFGGRGEFAKPMFGGYALFNFKRMFII